MENNQPREAIELSVQELDTVAGGATSDVKAETEKLTDEQFVEVVIDEDGGIHTKTVQSTDISKVKFAQFNQTGDATNSPV